MEINTLYSSDSFFKAEIQSALLCKEECFPYSKFISYQISIYSQYQRWLIQKRYSNFELLHKSIENKVNELPELPKKVIFNLDESIISERKIFFTMYMNTLLNSKEALKIKEVYEFFEIEKDNLLFLYEQIERQAKSPDINVKRRYSNISTMISSINLLESYKSAKIEKKETACKINCEKIDQLLIDLNTENCSLDEYTLVYSYLSFLQVQDIYPTFTIPYVSKLINGTKELPKSLIYLISNAKANKEASQCAFKLLCNLTSCELNPDYDKFLLVMKAIPVKKLIDLNLSQHILSCNSKYSFNCFKLISNFENPCKGITLNIIIEDDTANEKVKLWKYLYGL